VSCGSSKKSRKAKAKSKPQPHEEPNRPRRVYVCVYRQYIPERRSLRECVERAAEADPQLQGLYDRLMAGDSVYDWGDDPSFFSAEYIQGSAENAAWGVCRPNVRQKIRANDVVVFFCARRAQIADPIHYLFTGYGTAAKRVDDRRDLWRQPELEPFREHLNVLARPDAFGRLENVERFLPQHDNWKDRAKSPYILFDPKRSRFNMTNPTLVASAERGTKVETWYETPQAQEIRTALFEDLNVSRTLRTSAKGTSHPHINLTKKLADAGITVDQLVEKLFPLVRP
jgi:hypothetical protein